MRGSLQRKKNTTFWSSQGWTSQNVGEKARDFRDVTQSAANIVITLLEDIEAAKALWAGVWDVIKGPSHWGKVIERGAAVIVDMMKKKWA